MAKTKDAVKILERVTGNDAALRRRIDRARNRSLDPPMVLTSDGTAYFPEAEEERDEQGAKVYRGQPGSPGRVTARVRVIRDPRQGARLRPGEILVAPF